MGLSVFKKLGCFLILISVMTSNLFSQAEKKPTVCLNMIVKNEKDVIVRCLESVLPVIDYWVISDTGSSDGTQEIIKNYMKEQNIPGELFEEPWVDFAHNRNLAMEHAKGKGDYLLFIDADDKLIYDAPFTLPHLDKDFYFITMSLMGTEYALVRMVNNHLPWKWEGVLHEYLSCPLSRTCDSLKHVKNFCSTEGARSKNPDKFKNDVLVLEAALEKEPNNLRYLFYLAQSCRDARQYEKALNAYKKRSEMGGWNEEIFYSLYQIASLKEMLNYPPEEVVEAYITAYKNRPSRVEPLYRLVRYHRIQGNYEAGYTLAKIASQIPPSKDFLFVEKWQNDYGLNFELSICAYWIEKYEEAKDLCLKLAEVESLPHEIREANARNLTFAIQKIIDKIYALQ